MDYQVGMMINKYGHTPFNRSLNRNRGRLHDSDQAENNFDSWYIAISMDGMISYNFHKRLFGRKGKSKGKRAKSIDEAIESALDRFGEMFGRLNG